MALFQAICFFFCVASVLGMKNGIGGPGNTTFTVSLVAQGAPACISLTFNSRKACQSYFLTAHYQNCSYTPQVCQVYQPTFVMLTICSAKAGGNCTIDVPTAASLAPGAGLCFPAAIGQASTFPVAAVQDVNGNAAGAITFEYASNALCIQAAGVIQVLSASQGPCGISTMCRDASGNPSNVLAISPMANAGAIGNNFDICQIAGHLIVPYTSFTVDWGNVSCN
jgi:hypothetical protein